MINLFIKNRREQGFSLKQISEELKLPVKNIQRRITSMISSGEMERTRQKTELVYVRIFEEKEEVFHGNRALAAAGYDRKSVLNASMRGKPYRGFLWKTRKSGKPVRRKKYKNRVPVIAVSENNGKIISVAFESLAEAQRQGFKAERIRECLKGLRQEYAGYQWARN